MTQRNGGERGLTVLGVVVLVVVGLAAGPAVAGAGDGAVTDGTGDGNVDVGVATSGGDVDVRANASGGGGSVDCAVDASGPSCETGTPGGAGGDAGTLPGGQATPVPNGTELPVPTSPVPNGSDLPGDTTLELDPQNGTGTVGAGGSAGDREAGTTVTCDLSNGWLRLCGAKNTAPVKAADVVPADQLPDFPSQVPLSWGLLLLVVDSGVQEPQSLVGLAIGQAGEQTPEWSPVSPTNPPYNPNDPPVNLADLDGSLDPTVARSGATEQENRTRVTRALVLWATDEVHAGAAAGAIDAEGVRGAGAMVNGSDGQNDYRVLAEGGSVDGNPVAYVGTRGPATGRVLLDPNGPEGEVTVDLGGEPYSAGYTENGTQTPELPQPTPPGGGGGGGGGDLPVDGTLPETPALPA